MKKVILYVMETALALLPIGDGLAAELSEEVRQVIIQATRAGASVEVGESKDCGVFIVGVGRAEFRPGAVNRCREIAEKRALECVAGFLNAKVESKSEISVQENSSGEIKEFFSSLTTASVAGLLKGARTVSTKKNANGEIEAVVIVTTKSADASGVFAAAQGEMSDKGTVMAVGIDTDRATAEKNALRSAVEQVAGTMVAGKVTINEKEEMHKRLAVTAGALVEEYRVVKETKVEAEFRVEVVAKVSKKAVYESYKSYFKAIDNPTFVIESNEPALTRAFTQYFVDKGFDVAERRDLAHYVIRLDGTFTERKNPVTGYPGTMLNLSVEIVSTDGKAVLLKMSDRKSKDSEVLTRDQRIEAVSKMIFKKIHERLDDAIHQMVIKMLDDAE